MGGAGKYGTKDKKSRAKSSISAKPGETLEVTPWVTLKQSAAIGNDNDKTARKTKDCSLPLVTQPPKDVPRRAIPLSM